MQDSSGVCAIVVTFNRLKLLKECLQKIESQSNVLSHILVFNNASTDGTSDWLNKKGIDDRYIIVNSKTNFGGAGGFSRAVRVATEQTNDTYFWIMDDDTMPTNSSLNHLLCTANYLDGRFGFLCSKVLWKDKTVVNAPIIDKQNWKEKLNSDLIRVIRATFVSILISRSSIYKYGLPAADMVIWGDDTEYTTRLTQSSPSFLVLNSEVYHATSQNTEGVNLINAPVEKLSRYYYGFRNNLTVSRLYNGKIETLKIIYRDLRLLFTLLRSQSTHKFKRVKVLIRGMVAGMHFRPKIEGLE